MGNLNPTFRKELQGKKIVNDYGSNINLTRYELNQIRFWLNTKRFPIYKTPTILPVSKRLCLDFVAWETHNEVYVIKFKKVYFIL